jgi:predicted MPP superfamily phosphohydrolase
VNTLLVCSVTSAGTLLAGLLPLLRAPAPRPLGLPRVLLAASMAVFAAGSAVAYMILERGSFFLSVNIAYCALAIVAPLLGLAFLLLARRRGATRPARLCAWAALAIAPVAVYATFIEPYRLVTEHTRVPVAARARLPRPLTIAVLSDLQMLHVSAHERDAVRRAMESKPDLILLPGDLTQVGRAGLEAIRGPFHELVAPLEAPLGVFAVHGDCESADDARRLLEGTRVRLLVDESVHLEHEGLALWLCGLANGYGSPRSLAALAEFGAREPRDELRLVLAHRPDVALTLAPGSLVDLVVCGHTHGGQVQLPFLGPPFVLSQVSREVGAGGLSQIDGHRLYVSRGVGWEHGHAPRVRFLCLPEVSVLTLAPDSQP